MQVRRVQSTFFRVIKYLIMEPKIEIVPTLTVINAGAAIEFYKKAFGAIELMRNTDADGAIVAELGIGNARFVVAEEGPEYNNFSPFTIGGTPVRLGLQLQDPDVVFQLAVAAGAKEIYPVADQDYGYRLGHFVDPFGHHWEVFKPI